MSKNRYVAPKPVVVEDKTSDQKLGAMKSFSIARVEHGWVFITITSKDGEIIEIEQSDPDLKVIILEKYKIASQRYFNSFG